MKNRELKVAEELTNLTEDHWFNPIAVARYLSNQPYWTTDRVMEMVVYLIKALAERHERDWHDNKSAESLFLANQLYLTIEELANKYKWQNIKLPKTPEQMGSLFKET
jgi:hypothetical protein